MTTNEIDGQWIGELTSGSSGPCAWTAGILSGGLNTRSHDP